MREGEIADLVQKQGAAIRQFGAAGPVLDRPGKGSLDVPEQLGFEQVFGNGAAVERDEGALGVGRGAMDRPRDQFLAGAALAEHR